MVKPTRTIYKVEGPEPGDGPLPAVFADELDRPPAGRAAGGLMAKVVAIKNNRLFWAILGVAVLVIVMIIAIAALGAAESPAEGTMTNAGTIAPFVDVELPTSTESITTSTTVVDETPSTDSSGSTLPTSPATTGSTIYTRAIQPYRLVMPTIDVDAKIVEVGIDRAGGMEVPAVGKVGWYKFGPLPGASGPSVLVSHVSWDGTKGAFYSLKKVKAGDEFQVYNSDGDFATFQVDSVVTILKTKLPTEDIWNKTDQPVIRLITCGGKYDPETNHYLSNVIVYAHLVQ